MSGKMDGVDIQGEVASGVLALFIQISEFINKLINTDAQAANGDEDASASKAAIPIPSASPIADICEKTTQIFVTRGGKLKYNVMYNENIRLNIPSSFNLEANGLYQLDNNRLLVDEFNEKNKDQISLIQYYRFDTDISKNSLNCVVIHLIIKVGDSDAVTDTQNVYICVEYTSEGIINTDIDTACVYNNFVDYEKSKFRGVAPNLNNRNLRHNYKYLFLIQYQEMLAKEMEQQKNNGTKAEKSATPSSQLSPATTFTTKYSELSVSTRMYNMYTHGVEGLGKIAEERYSNHTEEINMLAIETKDTIGTIADQLFTLSDASNKTIKNSIKLAQAVNDLIDLAHDFGKISDLDMVIDSIYNDESDGFKEELKERLAALLSSPSGNIIVNKSHELQKANIVQLIEILRENLIIFPHIPAEKYLSRMQVFAEFIADIMSNPPPRRSNYTDSGKQVTIGTFKTYYGLLDEGDKILFNERVMRIMSTSAGASASAGAGAMDDVIRENPDKYPSIPKKIGLDGCSGGENAKIDVSANISDVYGILDVDISGNNNGIFKIIIRRADVKLLEWDVSGNFQITYDDVAKYIKAKYGVDFGLRGGDETPYKPKYDEIKLINGETMSESLKILLLQCLKTFCDKIYRTSMNDIHTDDNIANGVTHVYTTDSYFYGDIIIQYLAGLAKSIPTTLRAGEQRLGDEILVAENKAGAECNDGLNTGRGFYTNPGVDSSSYVDEHYKAILRKTLGYASMLQNLANQCCVQLTYTSGSGSESDSDTGSGSGSPRSTKAPTKNVFDFKLLENGKLFDSSPLALGSLIDGNIHSYRLINFVERFILNYKPDYKKKIIEEYEDIIEWLFQLECKKVIENVRKYVNDLSYIMLLSTNDDKDEIKKAIIQLPDLEDLLTMSTPSFCYENDDTLLLVPETFIVEEEEGNGLFDYSSDENNSLDTLKVAAPIEKQTDIASFVSVAFSLNDITITGANDSFKRMQKNQLVKEYTLKGGSITGPITLDLLYALKKLAPSDKIRKDINIKIDEIKDDFCSSCGLECNVSDVAMPGAKADAEYTGMTLTQSAAAVSSQYKTSSEQSLGPRISSIPQGVPVTRAESSPSSDAQVSSSQGLSILRSQSEGSVVRSPPRVTKRLRLSNASGAKRGGPGGGSRRRNPNKIPRRTIRRHATRRGQRRTIRRQRRNKKGTQKRRK